MVLLDRDDYRQCGYLIRKGEFEQNRQRVTTQSCADGSIGSAQCYLIYGSTLKTFGSVAGRGGRR
jgi:hypothetical protein